MKQIQTKLFTATWTEHQLIQGVTLNINSVSTNGLKVNLGATFIDSKIIENNETVYPLLTEKVLWELQNKLQHFTIPKLHLTFLERSLDL